MNRYRFGALRPWFWRGNDTIWGQIWTFFWTERGKDAGGWIRARGFLWGEKGVWFESFDFHTIGGHRLGPVFGEGFEIVVETAI